MDKEEALDYHSQGRRGKIEITPTKPCITQRDLSLAYTPGVAVPCLEIEKNPDLAYTYTAKGNLVGVVTNGTAVLGLGNIGALAGKPVMEGKAVLFKRFADVDAFDIELNTLDPDEIIRMVKLLEPTFGGINLEDIKAPECFYIEERLKEILSIPVFHDDQHGTAIITGAALLNALELVGKDIKDVRAVFNGAGAAGIACAKLYLRLGVKKENLIMCDTKGVIYKGREDGMNPHKAEFAADTNARTLSDAMNGADVFVGVSAKGAVTKKMVKSMNEKPIIFAMANPDPEINYDDAKSVRRDLIMATGRSDYPNQVNNVLGFPFIFRGALDVGAIAINEDMKIAAAQAIADLAKQDVPDKVAKAYGLEHLRFGPEYIIPKPFDPRVLIWESSAVAKAAMESGVARIKIDIEEYRDRLENRIDKAREVFRVVVNKAMGHPKRLVLPEGYNEKVLRASHILVNEHIAYPIILGREEVINEIAREHNINLTGVKIIYPEYYPKYIDYVNELYLLRENKGVDLNEAGELMKNPNVFGSMMVRQGDADALLSGVNQDYTDTIRPALRIIQTRQGVSSISGLNILILRNKILFLADTMVNIEPTAEGLAETAILSAEVASRFNIEPRVAMLSFSNFGSVKHRLTKKVRRAVDIVKEKMPNLVIDGEMRAETALVKEILTKQYPFSILKEEANVLIFPDLHSGNIAYDMVRRLSGAEAIGPILMGMRKSVHVLERNCDVNDIVNMAAIAVVEAK
jgi:malate dehydrogenase (oxaloacetate-decarboxylating)(NADP+)